MKTAKPTDVFARLVFGLVVNPIPTIAMLVVGAVVVAVTCRKEIATLVGIKAKAAPMRKRSMLARYHGK